MISGGGYYSELKSNVVGSTGEVIALTYVRYARRCRSPPHWGETALEHVWNAWC